MNGQKTDEGQSIELLYRQYGHVFSRSNDTSCTTEIRQNLLHLCHFLMSTLFIFGAACLVGCASQTGNIGIFALAGNKNNPPFPSSSMHKLHFLWLQESHSRRKPPSQPIISRHCIPPLVRRQSLIMKQPSQVFIVNEITECFFVFFS